MDYNFKEIERKWQAYWAANHTFKAEVDNSKPKYYVLDMFPYPSGAGLHVGHLLIHTVTKIIRNSAPEVNTGAEEIGNSSKSSWRKNVQLGV